MTFHVDSEIGLLRQAIVHRPGLELSRLTPENIGELLFDDVMWAKKAKEEHDAFAEALRDKGVRGALLRPVARPRRSSCPKVGTSFSTGCAHPRTWAPHWSGRSGASSRTSTVPRWPSSWSAGS